jgi:hypothetical protein
LNDAGLETVRIETLTEFIVNVFQAYQSTCHQYSQLASKLEPDEPYLVVKAGGGVYNSTQSITDFFSLLHPGLTSGAMRWGLKPTSLRVRVGECGTTVTISAEHTLEAVRRASGDWCLEETDIGQMEFHAEFLGCSSRIKRLTILPSVALETLWKIHTELTLGSLDWGLEHVCYLHDRYCVDDQRQFVSMTECLRFMTALPTISPACDHGGYAVGNSSVCRAKFAPLVSLRPADYCPILGYEGRLNPLTHVSCDDYPQCLGASAPLSPLTSETILDLHPCLEENARLFTEHRSPCDSQ